MYSGRSSFRSLTIPLPWLRTNMACHGWEGPDNSLRRYLPKIRKRLLRCERGDDFFKARVSPQRIPKRQQFQLTVADGARRTDGDGKLFAGEIFVASPRGDHRQIRNHERAIDCIFFHGKKLDRAPAFAQCFLFLAKSRVDQTKHAHRRAVIWFRSNRFLLLRACSSERSPCFSLVFRHTSDNAFH